MQTSRCSRLDVCMMSYHRLPWLHERATTNTNRPTVLSTRKGYRHKYCKVILYEHVISELFAGVEGEVSHIGDCTWCGESPTEVPVLKALVIPTSCSRAPQILMFSREVTTSAMR